MIIYLVNSILYMVKVTHTVKSTVDTLKWLKSVSDWGSNYTHTSSLHNNNPIPLSHGWIKIDNNDVKVERKENDCNISIVPEPEIIAYYENDV